MNGTNVAVSFSNSSEKSNQVAERRENHNCRTVGKRQIDLKNE